MILARHHRLISPTLESLGNELVRRSDLRRLGTPHVKPHTSIHADEHPVMDNESIGVSRVSACHFCWRSRPRQCRVFRSVVGDQNRNRRQLHHRRADLPDYDSPRFRRPAYLGRPAMGIWRRRYYGCGRLGLSRRRSDFFTIHVDPGLLGLDVTACSLLSIVFLILAIVDHFRRFLRGSLIFIVAWLWGLSANEGGYWERGHPHTTPS